MSPTVSIDELFLSGNVQSLEINITFTICELFFGIFCLKPNTAIPHLSTVLFLSLLFSFFFFFF